ncbi:MAG: hypothetical protein ACT4OV_05105 [Microthrixaceae bacterium]
MRARRGLVIGWTLTGAYALLMGIVVLQDVDRAPFDRHAAASSPAERFVEAWERSRRASFVATGTYERHSEVTGATLTSEDVLAQRPPRRLHRQLGGVEGRDDDRLIVCPAPPSGEEANAQPCRLGDPGGLTYAASVEREVRGLRSLTTGTDPLYRVRVDEAGCFDLRQMRIEPRAPFGVEASFCFDAATGAVASSRVRYAGGIVEVRVITSIRADVVDADLEP